MNNSPNMRQRILHIAREEMNKRSVKFTIDHLVTRLAISKKSLYKHFHSKQELIGSIIDTTLAEIAQIENHICQNSKLSLPEQLSHLLMLHFQIPQMFRKVVLIDLQLHYPEEWNKIERFRQERWQRISGLLQTEIDSGRIRPINHAIIQLITTNVLQEMPGIQPLDENTIATESTLQELVDILLTGIIIQPYPTAIR